MELTGCTISYDGIRQSKKTYKEIIWEPRLLHSVREHLSQETPRVFWPILCEIIKQFLEESYEEGKLYKISTDTINALTPILEDSYLPLETKMLFSNGVNALRGAYCALVDAMMNAFHKSSSEQSLEGRLESATLSYLDSYYELERLALSHWKVLKQGLPYADFLRKLLSVGCVFSKDGNDPHRVGLMTPLAPNYLSALIAIQQQIDNIMKNRVFWKSDEKDSSFLLSHWNIIEEVLLTSLCRYMRWYIVSPDGDLCHAALRTYSEEEYERNHFCLRICPLSTYTSFEGVRELRLFEKIKYELEHRAISVGEDVKFNIIVAGDLSVHKMEEFGHVLIGWLKDRFRKLDSTGSPKKISLQITVCTRNRETKDEVTPIEIADSEDLVVVLRQEYDTLFASPCELQKGIREADLLFLLDCKELYEEFTILPHTDLNGFLQLASEETYFRMHRRLASTDSTLSPTNRFFEMQNLLLGSAFIGGQPGFLRKNINLSRLSFMEDCLKESSDFSKSMYVYLSDIGAANELKWKDDYFVRTEYYSGKKFAILRYGEMHDKPLQSFNPVEDKQGNKRIVFNLWQFVKHISISQTPRLLENLFSNQDHELSGKAKDSTPSNLFDLFEKLYLLSEIFISFDFSDWREGIKVSCGSGLKPGDIKEYFGTVKGFEETLQPYLEKIIHYSFNKSCPDDLVHRYTKQCMESLLYSCAENVDSMLFLHLYKTHFDKLTVLPQQKINVDPTMQVKKGMKYSGKKYYSEIMRSYDTPADFFANQYRIIEVMQESGELNAAEVFRTIAEVCSNNQYAGSYLYKNCRARGTF